MPVKNVCRFASELLRLHLYCDFVYSFLLILTFKLFALGLVFNQIVVSSVCILKLLLEGRLILSYYFDEVGDSLREHRLDKFSLFQGFTFLESCQQS